MRTKLFFLLMLCVCFYTGRLYSAPVQHGCIGGTTLPLECTDSIVTQFPGGSWSSSNTTIAEFDPETGQIILKAAGTVTITYTVTTDCGTLAFSYQLTVDPLPIITGPAKVCMNATIMLSATPSGGAWSSSNTGIAIADPVTGNVTGIAVGTATITYQQAAPGCYTTKLITVDPLPVISGKREVCYNSSIILSGNPAPGIWASGNTSLATVSSSGTVNGVEPGSVIITYTGPNGCFDTAQIAVNDTFSISICEIAPVASCDKIVSFCNNLTLKVHAPAGATFSWSPSLPATDDGNGQFTFTSVPTVTTTYTVTVNSGGCLISDTIQVFVATGGCYPCQYLNPCATCEDRPTFRTITSSVLNSSNITDDVKYYYIAKNARLAVSPKPGDVFFMGQGVGLTVDTIIDLSGVHFFSSPCRWRGIQVINDSPVVGQLTINNGTLIEHADTLGVWVIVPSGKLAKSPASGDVIHANGAIFNDNWRSIYINRFTLKASEHDYPFTVEKSVFTYRNFCGYHTPEAASCSDYYPFKWPDVDEIREPVTTETGKNPKFKIDQYPGILANKNKAIGIKIDNSGYTDVSVSATNPDYYGFVIGDSSNADDYNIFDTLNVSVHTLKSNASLYNNIFRHTQDSGRIGINALGGTAPYGKNSVAVLSGYGSMTNNRFYNCWNGIYGSEYYNIQVCKAVMSSDSNAFLTPALTFANFGVYLINDYMDGKTIIEDNLIDNINTGIFKRVNGCFNVNAVTEIRRNTILGLRSSTSHETGDNGILISETGNCTTSTGTLTIASNRVEGYIYGIQLGHGASSTHSGLNAIVDDNTVVIRNNGRTSFGPRFGLSCTSYDFARAITNNLVYGDTLNGVTFNTPLNLVNSSDVGGYVGIHIVNSRNAGAIDVSCNLTRDIVMGYKFIGTNLLNWHNNVMQHHRYGMVLQGSGIIGQQGSACNPSDNVWYDWKPSRSDSQTYTLNSNPALSVLYVRNVTSGSFIFSPTNNGTFSSGTAYAPGVSIINAAAGGCTLPDSVICAPVVSEAAARMPGSSSQEPGNLSMISAAERQQYILFPNPGDGNITIKQSIARDNSATVRVMNYAGVTVYNGPLEFRNGESHLKIEKATPGLYTVTITSQDGSTTVYKLVINKQ